MNITPYSEKDLPRRLLEKGEYSVEASNATDEISKGTGKDMIKLQLSVWDGDKVVCKLFDYLLDSMPAKLRHACDTFGLLSNYERGVLCASDFIGRVGKAKITIRTDKTGQFPDKNEIQDYVCRPSKPLTANEPPHTDDDMPF